jgi:hypothetical protein
MQPIQIQSLRGIYTHPTPKGSIESGFQLRHTTVNTDFNYQNQTDTRWATDTQKSFVYDYAEQVNAAYVNYAAKTKKWNYQLGLRLEDSHAKGQTQNSTKANRQDYLQLFPSASFQYTPSDTNQFSVSYSRKITRASYSDLNDQIFYYNPYRLYVGNPNLKPAIMNVFEFNYNYNQRWFFVLGYSITKNSQLGVPVLKGNLTVFQTQNANSYEWLTFDVSYRKNISKIWRTSTGIILFQVRNSLGGIEGLNFRSGNSFYITTSNFFTLPNNWRTDLTFSYVSPQTLGMYQLDPFYRAAISVQKTFWNKLGEVRLSVSDIFNTYEVGQGFNTKYQEGFNQSKVESRFLQVSFNYRFGNTNIRIKERRIGTEREFFRINNNQ